MTKGHKIFRTIEKGGSIMEKLGRKIVKFRIPVFVISILLLIPAAIGYINTKVNYDILYYLPDEIETMKGQDILVDQFGTLRRWYGMTVLPISVLRWKCCRRRSEAHLTLMILQ